jgi:hypothetical protein
MVTATKSVYFRSVLFASVVSLFPERFVSRQEIHYGATSSGDCAENSILAPIHDRQISHPRNVAEPRIAIYGFEDRLSGIIFSILKPNRLCGQFEKSD